MFPHLRCPHIGKIESIEFISFRNFILMSLGMRHPAVRLKYTLSLWTGGVWGTSNQDQSLYKTLQNFYNERLYLEMARAKMLRSALQRLRINEEMN